jgi:hypothetical protein
MRGPRIAPVLLTAALALLGSACDDANPTVPKGDPSLGEVRALSTLESGSLVEINPTGTPLDLENVRAAVQAAQSGDVIRLESGTFDFSNAYVYLVEPNVVDNRLCLRSDITIEGEAGTVIEGPGKFYPDDPVEGFSTAFDAGGEIFGEPCPPYDNLTIRNLTIRHFTRGLTFGVLDPRGLAYGGRALRRVFVSKRTPSSRRGLGLS